MVRCAASVMYSPKDPQACRAGFRLVRAAIDGKVPGGMAGERRVVVLLVLGMLTFKCFGSSRREKRLQAAAAATARRAILDWYLQIKGRRGVGQDCLSRLASA